MNIIEVKTLNKWRKDNIVHQLIDVRESWEVEVGNMGGIHIPMNELLESIELVRRDIPVVVHCKSGARSAAVVHHLTIQLGYENVYDLRGGIIAWASEVDPNIEVA
ncbi:MAG: NADH oxidase [Bacteroidetes bacterium]|nr:MAG: NADH oxidase [Bacteroidota bacterium]